MNGLYVWIGKNPIVVRLDSLDVKCVGQAACCFDAPPGDGRHFDETQSANCFQMHSPHKACTNNCSSNTFHEARRLSTLMGRCKVREWENVAEIEGFFVQFIGQRCCMWQK